MKPGHLRGVNVNHSVQLQHLGRCLAGIFQNRQQALAEPALFVHLRLWIYPTTLFAEDSLTFFIEQASAAYKQPPYRQRILRVRSRVGELTAEYYALRHPQAYQGAAQTPEQLSNLTEADLVTLTNGCLDVSCDSQQSETRFEARLPEGTLCQFAANGDTRYVRLAFDVIDKKAEVAFLMYDKGIDPDSQKATWGALNGPFYLRKVEDFSLFLPVSTPY